MSMISEQVKGLRKLANQWKHNDVAAFNLIFEACDTIEALSAKVRDQNFSADRPTGWIPVGERLPSGQENVIVTIYDDHGDTPWEYTTNAWHIDGVWIADNDIVCGSVIAWMPLPEPYREGGEA